MCQSTQKGFTFVEMMMAMVIVSLLMSAMAAMMSTIGQAWNDQQGLQSMQMQANQVYARLGHLLASAKFVGQYTAGNVQSPSAPASIFFWAADNYPDGQTADGVPQTGEMAVLQYDPTSSSLYLYEAIPYSQMTTSQLARAGTVMTWSDMTDSSAPAEFEALDFVQKTTLESGNIAGAQFYPTGFSSSTQLPVIEFSVAISQSGQPTQTLYGSSTLRGPTTQPD